MIAARLIALIAHRERLRDVASALSAGDADPMSKDVPVALHVEVENPEMRERAHRHTHLTLGREGIERLGVAVRL